MAQIIANGSRGHHKFTLNVNESYVSGSSENFSNVAWSLVLSPIQAGWDWYYSGTAPVGYNIKINGSQVASGNIMNYDGSSTVTIASGVLKVPHNDNGTKTIEFSFDVWENVSASYLTGSASGNGSLTLTEIPRYATLTHNVSSKTETSLRVTWNSNHTIDHLSYSINNGTTWNDLETEEVTSGMYEITGLTPNTNYNIKTKIRRKDNQLVTTSSTLRATTYDYPYCTETPNFVIGEELTLLLYNPIGRLVTIAFIGANGESLSTDETSMNTVTGYNTESFQTKLYNSIPNSPSGKYQIKVTYEGHEKTTDNGNTYSVNESKCTPVFNDFTYKDIGKATSVTENDQVLIKGISNLEVTINSTNKMVTQNGATPNKYTGLIEGVNATANHSDEDVILNLGTIDNAGIKRLTVTAYDSRNISKSVYKDITVLDYVKPTINVEVARVNNFEAQTRLNVNGTYDKLTIDGVDKNSITLVEYRYRETGTEEWSSWATINTTLSNGKFTCNEVIVSLDNTKPFEIEVRATDKLDSNSATGSVEAGESIFFISTNNKKCYINGKQVMTGIGEDVNRTDLNDYINEFVAGYGHNLTNTPSEELNLGHILSIPRHEVQGYTTQLFSPYTTNDLYIRKCEDGLWGNWKKVTPEKNIITVGLSANTTYKSTSIIVPLDTILNKTGNKLSVDTTNNAIKIGSGVSKILVSGTLTQESTSVGLYGGYISKNGSNLASSVNVGFNYIPTANQFLKTTFNPVLVDVVEGDLIYLFAYTQNSATVTLQAYSGRAVNLTVEVIE